MPPLPHPTRFKTLQAAAWLVMVGFVLQMGSVSCGCFEHNGWVLLFSDADHEQSQSTTVASVDRHHGHSHSGDDNHNESVDQQASKIQLHSLHQCEPSAVVEGVLAEQIQLPETFGVTLPPHKRDARLSFVCSCPVLLIGHGHPWPAQAAARFVTQAFLI